MLTVPGFLAILIMTVPGATSGHCPSLCRCFNEVVDCSHKDLTHIEESVFNWTGADRLPELNLEYNRLTSLPAHIFDPLLGLKTLNLNHNQLQVLEVSLFSKLKHLKFLDMKGNQISTLPVGLFAFQTELISLDLRDNLLSTLDVKVMIPMPRLDTLNISGNPLNCDCNLQPVVNWSSVILEYTDAKCRFPPQYQDSSWNVLTKVECTSPLSTVIITPPTDPTPRFEIHRSTSVTNKVSSANNKQPGNVRSGDFDLYPVSIALIVVLIILTVVLIGVLVFISCYKRVKLRRPDLQCSNTDF